MCCANALIPMRGVCRCVGGRVENKGSKVNIGVVAYVNAVLPIRGVSRSVGVWLLVNIAEVPCVGIHAAQICSYQCVVRVGA